MNYLLQIASMISLIISTITYIQYGYSPATIYFLIVAIVTFYFSVPRTITNININTEK